MKQNFLKLYSIKWVYEIQSIDPIWILKNLKIKVKNINYRIKLTQKMSKHFQLKPEIKLLNI